jgi:DNA-binding CsgD family transcriptional regulator
MSKQIKFSDEDINKIIHQHTVLNLSCQEIGTTFNISKSPINKLLKELNLLKKGNSDGKKIIFSEDDKNKIKKLYLDEYKSPLEISKILNINFNTIRKIIFFSDYKRNKSEGTSIGLVKRFTNIPYNEFLEKSNEFTKYKRKVISVTKKQPIHNLKNFNRRGVSGVDGNYHLDHKFSIVEGFKHNISPEIIGHVKNLEFIPWMENVKKRTKCSINKEDLKID